MRRLIAKYLILVSTFTFVFAQFIACGAAFYQVSVEDDIPPQAAALKQPGEEGFGIHATAGWRLPIPYVVGAGMDATQLENISLAMSTWEAAVGRKLFTFTGVHKGVHGDAFPDLFSSLRDQINGHYADFNWGKTKKNAYVLATTIWENDPANAQVITTGDIRYNSENYLIGDSLTLQEEEYRQIVDLQSLALHELGHLLGLIHIDAKFDRTSIMNPQLLIGKGFTSRKLSRGDVERVQSIYGCDGNACNIDELMYRFNTPAAFYESDSAISAEISH